MSRRSRREFASVTFHKLTRFEESKHETESPWLLSEFDLFLEKLSSLPPLDLNDELVKSKVRKGGIVPIIKAEKVSFPKENVQSSRTIFGQFEGAYSGYWFKNSDKGEIPADSINQTPFYFLMYLTASGEVVVGTQYYGYLGDFTGLKQTLIPLLGSSSKIRVQSIISDVEVTEDIDIKEVTVEYRRKKTKLFDHKLKDKKKAIIIRKDKKDDFFSDEVKSTFESVLTAPKSNRKAKIVEILRREESILIDEDDIIDCKFLATFNGSNVTIRLFEEGIVASKFPMKVTYKDKEPGKGHPVEEDCKNEMWRLLVARVLGIKDSS